MADRTTLAWLLPGSLAATASGRDPGWQRRKSLATRNAVLEAALGCLAIEGYAACSLQSVANRAGISRGAMLHHYASRPDLIAAVVEYAFYQRMAIFLARIRALTDADRGEGTRSVAVALDVCQTPEYRAYLELHVAMRTDADLRDIFLDRARRYDRVFRDEVAQVFPEWHGDSRLEMLTDYVWSAIEGLSLNMDIWDDPGRAEAVLALVARTVRAEHDHGPRSAVPAMAAT